MGKIIIYTDSTADLSLDIREKMGIKCLPLYVNFSDGSYTDGVDLDTVKLYEKVVKLKELPKTSAIPHADFYAAFKEEIDNGNEILFICISKEISSTYQNAVFVKGEMSGKIEIVNSQNLSSGIALLVLRACKLRDDGKPLQEIKDEVERLVPLVKSQFAIKTLEYLHKGGRLTGLATLLGSILQIKPIIAVKDGKLSIYKKTLGNFNKALDLMLKDFFAEVDKDNVDMENIMITHSLADKSAMYMLGEVKNKCNPSNLIESHAGCVISSHCGAGTIGILYILKK